MAKLIGLNKDMALIMKICLVLWLRQLQFASYTYELIILKNIHRMFGPRHGPNLIPSWASGPHHEGTPNDMVKTSQKKNE